MVVGYGGDDVAVTFVGNSLSQLDSIASRAVTDLEAVFFQVVQLAAVNSFFAACSNVAVRYVTQSHRAACSTAYHVHFVARCIGRIACCIGISHRGIELHSGHSACGADVGYSALAVGEVDGVAVGHEVFVCAVTLYGKACVQYVVNGRCVVAFVIGSQCSTIVVGRIGGGSSGISQVALHVSQGGRGGGVAGCILHAGNHVASSNFVTACRCIIELAVRSFVHLRTVSFGVYHRGLGILYYSLGIQCVDIGLVAAGRVHFLFHSQTVTGSKGDFLAGFNGSGSGSRTAGQSAASSGLETAVVDGIGNVAGCGQFFGINCSWRGDFAVRHCQRGGSHCRFQLVLSRAASAGDVVRIPSFIGQSGYSAGITVNPNRVATGSRAYGNAVGQFEADFVVFNGGHNVAVTCIFNGFGQLNGVGCAVVGRNLEAVFFQVVQLAAVDGFFAACSNSTVGHTSNFVVAIIQTILS